MALISDPNFLIHSLRLNYLRNVDDPYGPRLISLDPSYHANAYILDAGLADSDKWPELNLPASAPPSDDEGAAPGRPHGRPSGFPGATGLKYTTTIMGGRTGGFSLRVNAKRASTSSKQMRDSIRSGKKGSRSILPDEAPQIEAIPPTPVSPTTRTGKSDFSNQRDFAEPRPSTSSLSQENKPLPAPPKEEERPPENNVPIPFIPKFKGAEEMEKRRRVRMLNRIPPGGGLPPRPPIRPQPFVNPEISSSSSSSSSDESDAGEEEDGVADEDDDFDDDAPDVDDSMEIEPDEFDPEFAASRETNIGIDSNSDGLSLLSGSGSVLSTSNISMVGSSSLPPNSAKTRNRLSPVHESRGSEEKPSETASENGANDSVISNTYFEMVTTAPNPYLSRSPQLRRSASAQPAARPSRQFNSGAATTSNSTPLSASTTVVGSHHTSTSPTIFVRRPVAPVESAKSALTAMLASTSANSSSNPFTELYSAISGRSDSENMSVSVFFPWAQKPNNSKAMELNVRKDATMEEVLGFALWSYWEEGWAPRLDEGLSGEEDPKWETKCSALGWIFRIAEDDGEVDEDFPPPDRAGRISKFNFDAYAVLEASTSQIQQNKVLDSKIQRRPSRIVVKKKKSTGLLTLANQAGATSGLAPPDLHSMGTSAGFGSMLGSSVGNFPGSLGPSSSHGPPMFLRIRIADMADAGPFSTTIQASGGMYMAEVLEIICAKRKFSNPKDYALVVDMDPTKILIPLDRTVKSLQGKRDLMLIKNNMLQHHGVEIPKTRPGRSTDPNASIFKRNSEVPEIFSASLDYASAYKRYTVYRKVPMLVGRSARLLAIDGGYIHIMPQANKAKNVFDSGKTSSYDIKSIVACQQSAKNSATFKLVVHRDAERNKRYEFEAESPQIANEIVTTIRGLKSSLDRSGTTKQSRRSRHVS